MLIVATKIRTKTAPFLANFFLKFFHISAVLLNPATTTGAVFAPLREPILRDFVPLQLEKPPGTTLQSTCSIAGNCRTWSKPASYKHGIN